ncbi:MAG: hypothetical protein ACI3ZQ_04900 [Candidatus Cryptobacteroides sp.]
METLKCNSYGVVSADMTLPKLTVGIVNPDTNDIISIDEWKQDAKTTQRAEFVAVFDEVLQYGLIVAKNPSKSEMIFAEAQQYAASVMFRGKPCRCPSRSECVFLYDARFAGMDAALKLIGGKPFTEWAWTCEQDTDPEYSQHYAFVFYGNNGSVNNNDKYLTDTVRPVSAFRAEWADKHPEKRLNDEEGRIV